MQIASEKSLIALVFTIVIAVMVAACAPSVAPEPKIAQPVATQNSAPAPAASAPSASNPLQSIQPPSGDQTVGQFEPPAVVKASDLLQVSSLTGPGFYVEPQVPTNGAMGQYTIVADSSVFHSDAGTYQVESLDLLKIRLSEIPAIIQLENMSQTEVFAKALGASAERPVKDAAQMVIHPMDTVTGLPSGVGEFFGRVDLGAQMLYSTATNSSESGQQRATQAADLTGNLTLTAFGYDQDRRNLARKLHVDPYSSDPILTRKLNQMAWAMFYGRIAVDAVVSVAVPGSMLITGVQVTDDLVYQTPKADLILRVEKGLKGIGLSRTEIAAFSHNNAIPLSLQVTAVHYLEKFGPIPGRRTAAVALASVLTEYQARFLVASMGMLVQWSQQNSPITALQMQGVLAGTDQNGEVILPAPVDYVSWTPRIAGFATNPALLAIQNRVLWIPAGMTPLAQQQLKANGWSVHQGAQL